MGSLFGLDSFLSKAERERSNKEFEGRIFPHGLEAQRGIIKERLAQLLTGPATDEERLFAFIATKDAYTSGSNEQEGLAMAKAQLKRLRWLKPSDAALIMELVRVDSGLASLDGYPEAEAIARGLKERQY
ncbi:MAG: hypothetical protein LBH39_02915 [Clostridiales Family XIII bacterium]|nr:hypothetical protein [Clostridiales Family XIII bacterium]